MKIATILFAALTVSSFGQIKSPGINGENINSTPFLNALGGTSAGKALFALPNQTTATYLRINADESVTALDAASFLSDIGGGSGGGSFAGITGQPSDNTNLNAALNLKVDDSQLSTVGGANKVLQADTNGDWQLGPYANGAPGNVVGANINIPAWRNISFRDTAGVEGAKFWLWPDHNGSVDELLIESSGTLYMNWVGGWQHGIAVGGNHYEYYHSGSASAGLTKRQSVPLAYYNYTWTGGVNTWNQSVMQVAPLDTSGTNSAFQFFRNVTSIVQDVEGSGVGVKFAEIAPAGVWSAGTAPAPDTLTPSANTYTLACSKYKTVQFAKMTLGVTNTLAISGAIAGMRGIIYATQDATGGRLLTMPSGSALPSDWALSSLGNKIDRLEWDFDGTFYYWTIKAGLNTPLDSDASAFLTATGITDDTQRTAINNLTLALKASGSTPNTLWEKTYRLFPFIGNDATKHRYELKTATAAGTFSGSGITHSVNGITGDGVNGFMRTGFVPSASAAQNSIGVFVYNRTTLPLEGGAFIAGYGTGGIQVGIERAEVSLKKLGLNNNDITQVFNQSSDFRGLLFAVRSGASSEAWGKVGGGEGAGTIASTANCDTQIALLGRFDSGATYDHPSDANLAAAIITKSLDSTERAALKTIIDTYQTSLGRQNP